MNVIHPLTHVVPGDTEFITIAKTVSKEYFLNVQCAL